MAGFVRVRARATGLLKVRATGFVKVRATGLLRGRATGLLRGTATRLLKVTPPCTNRNSKLTLALLTQMQDPAAYAEDATPYRGVLSRVRVRIVSVRISVLLRVVTLLHPVSGGSHRLRPHWLALMESNLRRRVEVRVWVWMRVVVSAGIRVAVRFRLGIGQGYKSQ